MQKDAFSRDYVAGFFDGEGCIIVGRSRPPFRRRNIRYQLAVSLANKHRACLLWLKETFGGTVGAPHTSGVSYWQLNGNKALVFLQWISSALVVKRPQAELAMEFQITKTTHHPLTSEELAFREHFFVALQEEKKAIHG